MKLLKKITVRILEILGRTLLPPLVIFGLGFIWVWPGYLVGYFYGPIVGFDVGIKIDVLLGALLLVGAIMLEPYNRKHGARGPIPAVWPVDRR